MERGVLGCVVDADLSLSELVFVHMFVVYVLVTNNTWDD